MRNLREPQLPEARKIPDPTTAKFAKAINVELDNLRRGVNKYASRLVLSSETSAVTLDADDEVVLCNGTFTVTLPLASSCKGKLYYIKNIGSGTITIDGNSSETIDDSTTKALYQYESKQVVSDGSEWWII